MSRCLICKARAVHSHHVVYAQHVSRAGGDLKDPRNLVPLCFSCHGAHHARSRVIPLSKLPDAVYEFARGLLGPAAFDYLQRRYAGEDPRLDAILMEAA